MSIGSSATLTANAKAIDAILARNNDQATAFGFKGTPSFIVGKFRVPGVLTMAEFDQAIADARKAAASKEHAHIKRDRAETAQRKIGVMSGVISTTA